MAPPTRPLGRNGPQVPAIGFGAMSIGGAYGQKDTTEEKLKVLDRAWEIGQRFWDTADIYADSEDRIGEWFKKTGKRDDIFVATKFGLVFTPSLEQTERSDPEYVRSACEKSLQRLGVETIDLYYCHRVDSKTPIEKTIEAMVQLKKEGKIRYLGLSEVAAADIRRAHAVHPISAVQVEYSLFSLDIESPQYDVLRTCRELGISLVAYSPVGRGLLTGQIRSFDDLGEHDFRRFAPRYSRENFPAILKIVDEAETIAKKHGCTPSQVCLAWLLAQGEEVIPIPGTRTIKYLEENTAAADLKLTPEEVSQLRAFAEASEVKGDRYPASMMGPIFRETPQL
ncbi:NADP-dependent oxidoreductase domain-containing protein [Cercophora newfieldiana]|uniref:NADP-dependent oxidoreductase domain-containing protein n=1 Tax=Cercophora newfieldiana TaxID=92897 RepID=A0AA40CSJ6_9PEZI|nr:NADP-dependent oxidoreductase domain-containing protein [Cercophora newfieldiana]